MTITVNTKAYAKDLASSPNSVPFLGPLHDFDTKDRFDLYRTPPKASAVFSGVSRSRVKLSRTHALTGALTTTGDSIVDINVSVAVGTSAADIDALYADAAAALAQSWASDLAKKQVFPS